LSDSFAQEKKHLSDREKKKAEPNTPQKRMAMPSRALNKPETIEATSSQQIIKTTTCFLHANHDDAK